MSSFVRLSMGVKYGVQGAQGVVLRPATAGTRYFFTFSSVATPRSEQLADEPVARRSMEIRMSSAPRSSTAAEEYWRLPWHRAFAPATMRAAAVRVIWSRRVGM